MRSLVLIILLIAISRLYGSDLEQLARDLAERIAALPEVTDSIRLIAPDNGAISGNELRELRRMVGEELKKRHLKLSQEPAALTIEMTFTESLRGRLLVAEIRAGQEPNAIVLPVPAGPSTIATVRRVSLQRSLVWRQDDPILDFAALPGKILILSPTRISLIENQEHGWKEQCSWDLGGVDRLPRDPRGRLLLNGSEFRAYLPRNECHAAAEPGSQLQCEPSDRGWPVLPADPADTRVRLSAGRNYFDQLRSAKPVPADLPAFYAAAVVSGQKGPVWAVSTVEGETRFYDSRSPEIYRTKAWGPNLASLEVPECGSWFLAITEAEAGKESLQAFQWAGDRPVAGSERVELEGVSTALWADEGNRVRLVTRDLKSGRYAAWSVALACAD